MTISVIHFDVKSLVKPLLAALDDDQARELSDLFADSAQDSLSGLCKLSACCFAGLTPSGDPVFIGGAIPNAGAGALWMVAAASRVAADKKGFLRATRQELAALHERWPVLRACVDERREKSFRWLEWLGFVPATEGVYMERNYRVMELRDARVRPADGRPNHHRVSPQPEVSKP